MLRADRGELRGGDIVTMASRGGRVGQTAGAASDQPPSW
jgi:hypothetical protein